MIFAANRPALLDGLLFATAVAALAVNAWPTGVPRQTIRVRPDPSVGGAASVYSLRIDDPQLKQIREALAQGGRSQPPSAKLAVAKWELETALFYAKEAGIPDDERKVSQPAPQPVEPASSKAYWLSQADVARKAIEALERERTDLAGNSRPDRVTLGPLVEPGPTSASLGMAGLLAVLAFGVHAVWAKRTPAIALPRAVSAVADSAWTAPGMLALEFPSSWVSIRQPLGVRLRSVCLAGIVLASLALSLV